MTGEADRMVHVFAWNRANIDTDATRLVTPELYGLNPQSEIGMVHFTDFSI